MRTLLRNDNVILKHILWNDVIHLLLLLFFYLFFKRDYERFYFTTCFIDLALTKKTPHTVREKSIKRIFVTP